MAVTEILALLNSQESNFEQIVQRLSPEMAAKFLNMANSAYYGVEVRTIDFAVRVLGYSGMTQVLLTCELLDHFSKCEDSAPFRFERYVREARFCARVSRILGRMLGYRDPAESANYPMELVVRSSAGLLERMPMARSLDISDMEGLLLRRIEGGMDGRQEVEMPLGDLYEEEDCRRALLQAEDRLLFELASLFPVAAAADAPHPFSQRS